MSRLARFWVLGVIVVLMFGVALPVLAADPTVKQAQSKLGMILTDSKGMTLYLYTKDKPAISVCVDQCAVNWPPLTVPKGQVPTLDAGIAGVTGVITRTDGLLQVTYNGWPLYYFAKDQNPGDTLGQDVGKVWFVLNPAPAPTVLMGSTDELGAFLVGANGMTLYLYTPDKPNESTCYDNCAKNWPPLTVPGDAQPVLPQTVAGALTLINRTDGIKQVAYNGAPLYYWVKDQKPGDTTGQNVGKVWFVVPWKPSAAAAATATPVVKMPVAGGVPWNGYARIMGGFVGLVALVLLATWALRANASRRPR